jgi:son of sevenless-like protein
MTQSAVSALQRQISNTPYNNSSSANPATVLDHADPALDESGADPSSSNLYFNSHTSPLMNGIVGTAPPGAMYVRALYDYEADDRTSLSFHEGDVIQVITQLESGWWDGVINGVRGWFPSNYCQIITSADELPDADENGDVDPVDDDVDDPDAYDEVYDEDAGSDPDDLAGLPLEGPQGEKSRADFWIPQATPDGRLFYYNTLTGETSVELPLESPSSVDETGPRDRMNINMPEKTRPPPEMMARGLTQDEEDESDVNSASELEGESILMGSRGSLVSFSISSSSFFFSLSLSLSLHVIIPPCLLSL